MSLAEARNPLHTKKLHILKSCQDTICGFYRISSCEGQACLCYGDGTTSWHNWPYSWVEAGVSLLYLHQLWELVCKVEAWKCPFLNPEKAEKCILGSQTLRTYF